jgi:hypothetical protein
MGRMRNYKPDMTFDRADGIARGKHKKTTEFFANCQAALEKYGKNDEAFYFEMIKDHLMEGGELDPDKATRILGL